MQSFALLLPQSSSDNETFQFILCTEMSADQFPEIHVCNSVSINQKEILVDDASQVNFSDDVTNSFEFLGLDELRFDFELIVGLFQSGLILLEIVLNVLPAVEDEDLFNSTFGKPVQSVFDCWSRVQSHENLQFR